jgi:hypothetical protein
MAVSAYRTLVFGAPPSVYGVFIAMPPRRWPMAEPEERLDYSVDVSGLLADVEDTIFSVSVAVSPSGAGELTLQNIAVNGGVITVWTSGGVPGRDYLFRVDGTTVAGLTFGFPVNLRIDPMLAANPLPAPPSLGFGSAITWSEGQTMLPFALQLPATTVMATGTTQLTACVTTLSDVLINAAQAAGAGVLLAQAATFNGAQPSYTNESGVPVQLWPYFGDTIGSADVSGSVTIQNHQTARFRVANSGALIIS